jgi:hypothetical protein
LVFAQVFHTNAPSSTYPVQLLRINWQQVTDSGGQLKAVNSSVSIIFRLLAQLFVG